MVVVGDWGTATFDVKIVEQDDSGLGSKAGTGRRRTHATAPSVREKTRSQQMRHRTAHDRHSIPAVRMLCRNKFFVLVPLPFCFTPRKNITGASQRNKYLHGFQDLIRKLQREKSEQLSIIPDLSLEQHH